MGGLMFWSDRFGPDTSTGRSIPKRHLFDNGEAALPLRDSGGCVV